MSRKQTTQFIGITATTLRSQSISTAHLTLENRGVWYVSSSLRAVSVHNPVIYEVIEFGDCDRV